MIKRKKDDECEWYEYVSTLVEENRQNNTFLSTLKEYLNSNVQEVLQKFIYVAEFNNLVSAKIHNSSFFQDHILTHSINQSLIQ